MKVEVRRNKSDKKPLEVEFDFGKDAHEAIAKFNKPGPYGDVVLDLFIQGAKLQLREFVLERVEAKVTGAALQSAVNAWKPELRMRGKPPLDKARKLVKTMSPEEREALLKELQGNSATA